MELDSNFKRTNNDPSSLRITHQQLHSKNHPQGRVQRNIIIKLAPPTIEMLHDQQKTNKYMNLLIVNTFYFFHVRPLIYRPFSRSENCIIKNLRVQLALPEFQRPLSHKSKNIHPH